MRLVRPWLFLFAILEVAAPAMAQSLYTASLAVTVKGPDGAAIKDVTVTILSVDLNVSRELVTDAAGHVLAIGLPPSSYTVNVKKLGLPAVDEVGGIDLLAGDRALVVVTAPVEGAKSHAELSGTGMRRDPAAAVRFGAETLGSVPTLGRKLTILPLLDSAFRPARATGDLFLNTPFVVSGATGRRETTFLIDGVSVNEPRGRQSLFQTLPIGAVDTMTTITAGSAPDVGWTTGPVVSLLSRSGANTLHGELSGVFRPGSWSSAAMSGGVCPSAISSCVPTTLSGLPITLAAPTVPDSLQQFSVAAGGPLVEDQVFFFGSFEYSRQTRINPVQTLIAAPDATVKGLFRQMLGTARFDQRLTDQHTFTSNIRFTNESDSNAGDAGGGIATEQSAMFFRRQTFGAAVRDTRLFSPRWMSEVVGTYQQGNPISELRPLTPSIQFVRAGAAPFIRGESRNVLATTRQAEGSDTFTFVRGQHTIRTGGGVTFIDVSANDSELGNRFTYGQFILNSTSIVNLTDLTLNDVSLYRQAFGLGLKSAAVRDFLVAAFVQDTWHARPNMTVDLGLRYDVQTRTDARANLAPRVSMAWTPRNSAKTIVRASYGLYYAMIRSSELATTILNGPTGLFAYTAAPGQIGFPTSLATVPVTFDGSASTAPPRDVSLRAGQRALYATQITGFDKIPDCASGVTAPCYATSLTNPRSQVISGGLEHRLGPKATVSADYVHQHVSGIEAFVDVNAPSAFARTAAGQVRTADAADATRPLVPVAGGFRSINVLENIGTADYDGVTGRFIWRPSAKLTVTTSYTLSRSMDTLAPDGTGAGPNDGRQLSSSVERAPSVYDQRHRLVISGSWTLPGDWVLGTFTQLASGLPLNAITGVDNNGDGLLNDRPVIGGQVTSRLSFRGSPTADVAVSLEKQFKFTGGSLIFRGEAVNIFNHANIYGRNSVYGDGSAPLQTFGHALAAPGNFDVGRTFQFIAKIVF